MDSATWKSASRTPRCSVPKLLLPSREQIFCVCVKPVLVFRDTEVQIRFNELISKKLSALCLLSWCISAIRCPVVTLKYFLRVGCFFTN